MATILLVGPSRDVLGGVTTHLDVLYASALSRENHYLHFQVGKPGTGESAFSKLKRAIGVPFAFARALRRSRAALVHLNPSMDRSFWRDLPLLMIARAMGVPAVLQIHGGELPERFCAQVPGAGRVVRAALRAADQVVVLARVEFAAFGRVLDAGRLNLIPNAIDVTPYSAPKPQSYDGSRPLRAVYLGRVVRSKGLFEACSAVHRALAAGARVEYLIAGAGPDSDALAQHIEELGLSGAVRMVGPLYGKAKTNFLLEADVFLFPTRHPEGLPYALLETMAAATPAITTAVGAIGDVVDNGSNGLLVADGDVEAAAAALTALAAAPERLQSMAAAARQRVFTAYSTARLERDFSALYARTLKPYGSATPTRGPTGAKTS